MNTVNNLHFCSETGWFGDAMPLYENGTYHIYYTKLRKDDGKLCWGHISSANLIDYTEHADSLLADEDDKWLLTGCVIKNKDIFYAFYAVIGNDGRSRIFRAKSFDGVVFQKERQELVPFDDSLYSDPGTWRDPCVFWNENEKCWWMVFCAKAPFIHPNNFHGCLGLAKSSDFENWVLQPPFWNDGITSAPECPDIFKLGNRWALIYYWHDTRIRFADDLYGNWERTKVISPDHFDFMAAKHMSDGTRNILAGWIPRKKCDCSERTWGGNLAIPRELYIKDGSPATRFVNELDSMFPHGKIINNDNIHVDAVDKGIITSFEETPADYRLQANFELEGGNLNLCLFIRADDEIRNGYAIIFDRPAAMIRLRELYEWDQRPDLAVIPWYDSSSSSLSVDLVVHEDILEMCVDSAYTMVSRFMKNAGEKLAIYIQDGVVDIKSISISAFLPD
ncbi:MAG: glycoside hydrolase family protein [Saccharofermentanales bacterium]